MIEEKKIFEDAVGHLYSVFSEYPLRPDTGACSCCHEPEEELKLHSKPLRELTEDDLERYGYSALLTWGSVDDYKHFLPRLFEIASKTNGIDWIYKPIIFAKLQHAEWWNWPENERNAVENYIHALWRWFLVDINCNLDPNDLLCGIAHALEDMTPFLIEWRNSDLVGLHKLAKFVIDQAGTIVKKMHLSDGFWSSRRVQMRQIIDWLLEPATKDVLENTFLESTSNPLLDDIATGADWLNWLAKFHSNMKKIGPE